MNESRVCRPRESFVVAPGTIGLTTGYDRIATGGSDQLKKFEYVLEGGK